MPVAQSPYDALCGLSGAIGATNVGEDDVDGVGQNIAII